MITYYLLLISILLFSYLLKLNFPKVVDYKHPIFIIFYSGSIFLIMSFRDLSVGTDIVRYFQEYYALGNNDLSRIRSTELGYSFVNLVGNKIGLNFQTFLSLNALFFIVTLTKLYVRFSRNLMLSYYLHITIGVFAMSLTGLRQTLAISFTMLAFINFVDKKYLKYFILVVIAALFHNTAIIFLVLPVIKGITIVVKKLFIIYFLFIGLSFLGSFVKSFIDIIVPTKYELLYLSSNNTININPLVVIVFLFIPLSFLFLSPRKGFVNPSNKTMSLIFSLSCLIFLIYIFAHNIRMFERMAFYFITFNTILIPNAIEEINSSEIKVIAIILCITLPFLYFFISIPGSSYGIDWYIFFR